MSLRDNAEAIAVEEDVSDQRISFIENDPVIQKLFEDAIEVLRLVGANENVEYSNQQSSGAQYLKKRRREEVQIHHKNERPANKQPEMTKSKRRKLEKIKAPVTILRKPQQEKGNKSLGFSCARVEPDTIWNKSSWLREWANHREPKLKWLNIEPRQIIHLAVSTDEEQEVAVKRMLHYVGQMPSQEVYQPPPVPFVSLSTNVKEGDCIGNTQSTSESIQDSTYLSNEKDISLWKMLVASPAKCNVFVGGLSPEVSSEILHAAFKTFIVEEEEKDKLKAHVVLDFKSQHPRGYGFVTFPNRRSTELGLICMQDFEIYGRTMQLGWGQKDLEVEVLNDGNPRSYKSELQSVEQHTLIVKKKKKKGNIVCDTVYLDAKDASLKQAKSHSSRWDQEMPKKYQRTTEDAADQDECEDGRGAKNQRVIQWVTHAQKVALVKLVCANLRSQGVSGHIGVFGIHYEADNSRLYVVCAKHVTAPQLYDEFSVFGSAQVKLNFDANGMSKGCAFIQYTNSKSAEKAIKQLHGKVVGGMPMKVMVAEPKVHGGSRKKNAAMQI